MVRASFWVDSLILFWASQCSMSLVGTPSMARMTSPAHRLATDALLPGVTWKQRMSGNQRRRSSELRWRDTGNRVPDSETLGLVHPSINNTARRDGGMAPAAKEGRVNRRRSAGGELLTDPGPGSPKLAGLFSLPDLPDLPTQTSSSFPSYLWLTDG